MKMRSTKKALIASLLCLCLCFSMLIGTTFAWFTDSVSSSGNKIVAGTLDIDLVDANGNSLAGEMIEWATRDGRAQDEIYWEPGCTYETEEFYIVNKGNLDLKFKFDVTGIDGDAKLLEVIDFTCMADVSGLEVINGYYGTIFGDGTQLDLLEGYNGLDEYKLEAGAKIGPIKLSGHMDEAAGNEYQGLTIEGIAISLIAAQVIGEKDSFNELYDENATYSYYAKGSAAVVEGKLPDGYVKMYDQNTGASAGSVTVPEGAIAEGATAIDAIYKETVANPKITVDNGHEIKTFDITVTGIKSASENTETIQVWMNIGAGFGDLKLYHYEREMTYGSEYTYDINTGILKIYTTGFSPFSITYDPDPEISVPEIIIPDGETLPLGMPQATVTDVSAQYANTTLPGLGDQQLNTVFVFNSPYDETNIADCLFKDWACDFVVSISKDIDAEVLYLGGFYAKFSDEWVGFTNPGFVAANEEIYLLGSVTEVDWTYEGIAINVNEFLCGVAVADDATAEQKAALDGAVFTVALRLTNPNNSSEYYDVNIVKYTFNTK